MEATSQIKSPEQVKPEVNKEYIFEPSSFIRDNKFDDDDDDDEEEEEEEEEEDDDDDDDQQNPHTA